MLLQPIAPKFALNYHRGDHQSSAAMSFSSRLLNDSTLFVKLPSISNSFTRKNPGVVSCSSISQVHSYGTIDFEKRPMPNWSVIYKKISMMEDPKSGAASVLNQVENGGKRITKWELSRVVKELRRFRRYKFALEVYEWMNNRLERFRMTTSDTAIQLDLISKVYGIPNAEHYFLKLPDALKDKRIYGSLLNAYVREGMREKAEALMDRIRDKDYAIHALPFNVMMTLYASFKDHEKIESLVLEMKDKGIALDLYSYNIWMSSCGLQRSVEKMEQVFEQMQMDPTINPNWTTFSTLATIYIKLGHLEKAEGCLREIESRITGRDRMPYHYLISHYGSTGNKEEVYRVWNIYKAAFLKIPNFGYHSMISSLVRLGDVDGAEKIYEEWLSLKPIYDPRVGNLLLTLYVKKGFSEKATVFFDQMIEVGGKPNAMSWEIISETHIRNAKIPEALSCLKNAASAEGPFKWKPNPTNISFILNICEQQGDAASKDVVMEILKQVGCSDDTAYTSRIPATAGAVADSNGNGTDEAAQELLNQLSESL